MPRARGRVRRVAPRLGARARRGRVRHAAVGVHQRPRPHRARARAVHAPARSRRRARRRRHHRVVGRAGRVPRDAQRVEHRSRSSTRCGEAAVVPRRRRVRRSTTSPPTRVVLAVQGPEARELLAPVAARRGRGRRGSRVERGRPTPVAPRAGSRAPATPARTASSCTCPPTRRSRCWQRAARRRDHARRARAPATRCGSKPGCRCTATSSGRESRRSGRAGLGGALRQGRLPGPRRRSRPRQDRGVARRLRGLVVDGRQIPREGYPVLRGDGEVVGEVTSGNFSPTLEHGIALAFLPPDVVDGDALTVDIRGRERARHRHRSCRSSAGSLDRDVSGRSSPTRHIGP